MSYLATSGFLGINWGGGSGVTDVVKDARRHHIDFSDARRKQKSAAFRKVGSYKNADGSLMTFTDKRNQPVTSAANALGLIDWWRQLGQRIKLQERELSTKGKAMLVASGPVGWGAAAAAVIADSEKASERLEKINKEFESKVSAWKARWLTVANTFRGEGATSTIGGQRADELWDGIISWYAIQLDNVTWVAANIESATERLTWAVSEAAKEAGKAMTKPFEEALEFYNWLLKVMKWTIIGTAAALGAYVVHSITKKRKT